MVLGEELVLGHEAPPSNNQSPPKSKIPLRTIDCSDCVVRVGQITRDGAIVDAGTPYYVHEGEWVKVMPAITVMEVMANSRLYASSTEFSDFDKVFGDLCKQLSLRVIEWNWTDNFGHALEQPFHRPDVLALLTTDELVWLSNAISREPEADRKNG